MRIFFFIFILIPFDLFSQTELNSDDHSHSLTLFSDISAGSDLLTIELMKQFYNDGFISRQSFLTNINPKANKRYYAGADIISGVMFSSKMSANRIIHGLEISDRQVLGTGFEKDAYQLVFLGNKGFRDLTADLAGTKAILNRYQQIKYHFRYRSTDSSLGIFCNLAYLKGEQYTSFVVHDGSLSVEGFSSVSFNLNAEMQRAGSPGLDQWNGHGAGMGFGVQKSISNLTFNFTASDFGMIKWNNPELAEIDTSFNWSGTNLNGVVDTSSLKALALDPFSILNFRPTRFSSFTPAKASISVKYKLKDDAIIAGFDYFLFVPSRPDIVLKYVRSFNTNYKFSVFGGHGGFTSFYAGMDASVGIRTFDLYFSVTNPHSFLMPGKSRYAGVSLALKKRF